MLLVYCAGGVVACVMLVTFAKSGQMLKSAFGSAVSGLMGLAACWGAQLLGLTLVSINPVSALTAVFLGLPGVIGLMLIHLIVR